MVPFLWNLRPELWSHQGQSKIDGTEHLYHSVEYSIHGDETANIAKYRSNIIDKGV